MTYQKNQIEKLANEVLLVTEQNSVDFIDVSAIAKYFGLNIEEVIFDNKNISGMINYKDKLISIENRDKPYRKRFSIAHEIGHYVLHNMVSKSDKDEEISFRMNTPANKYDTKESEADHFAATLLMPEDKVRSLWSEYGTISEVSDVLRVSQSALALRLQYLGIEC